MAVQISGNDITVPRDGSFTRNVTIGGTLTYEDVTNIDSVGLITARTGIEIGARPGVAASISVDGNMIVSGISTFGGDVQVPDKIVHTGDTNTALRFPAADTITAETGGSERLRITSTGKINIGDTQMSSNLLNIEDGTAAAIDIASHGTGGDTAYIGVKKSAGGGLTFGISNRDFIFKTGATYSNGTTFDSGTQRFKIDTGGLLKVGSGSATAKVDITSDANKAAIIIKGTDDKSGYMFGKRIHNGSAASSNTVTILTVNSFQSPNSHIYGRVTIMGVSPTADYGFKVEGYFYAERGSSNTNLTNTQVGTMDLQGGSSQNRGTGSSAQGTLSWSGTSLQYNTAAVAYADMHVNLEYHVYDGGTVNMNGDKANF